MKQECEYTRTNLERYLKGYVFKIQQRRIERHLAHCPVCRSEYDALRRIHETRHFLREIEPAGGIAGSVRQGFARFSWLPRLFFRPLWLAAIIGALAAFQIYIIHPFLHDPDLERLDPGTTTPASESRPAPATAATPTLQQVAKAAEPEKAPHAAASAVPAAKPLEVVITIDREHEKASIRKINDVLREHAVLRSHLFSEAVRDISGSLSADELSTFVSRVKDAGAVSFKRSRLTNIGGGDMVPFVIRLKTAAARPAPVPSPAQPPPTPAAPAPLAAAPASKPADTAASPAQ